MVKDFNDFDAEEAIAILNMSPLYSEIKDIFANKSIFEITATHRSEKVHSNFLKWLLSEESFCKKKDTPFIWFLDILLKRAKDQGIDIDENLKNNILTRSIDIKNYKIELERETKGVTLNSKTGRIDLLISCDVQGIKDISKLTICIENKVDSDEHDDQTLKYYAYLTGDSNVSNVSFDNHKYDYSKEQQEYQLFVFLTPHSKLELDDIFSKKGSICSCKDYIIINYQDIMDFILERIENQQQLPERIRFMIEEYINTLSLPYIDNFENNKYPIMAMDEKKRNLLSDFWVENKNLILAAVTAYAEDDKTPAEEREIANQVAATMKKPHRKFKTMDNNQSVREDGLSMTDIAIRVATSILTNSTNIEADIKAANKAVFNISSNTWRTIPFIIEKPKTEHLCRCKPINVYNKKYYVTTQWGYDANFKQFMSLVNGKKDGFKNVDFTIEEM